MTAYSAGGLAGQVLDEHGNGVAGTVWLSDRPPFEPQQGASGGLGVVDVDGSFRVTPLDDGVYWIRFSSNKQRPPWFYPGVSLPESAASVTVVGGQVTEGLRMIVTQ